MQLVVRVVSSKVLLAIYIAPIDFHQGGLRQPVNWYESGQIIVMGAHCRKMDPKIVTLPKTQSRSKDQNKDKNNSKENQVVKLNIVKPESFTQ